MRSSDTNWANLPHVIARPARLWAVLEYVFGAPESWPHSDLIGFSEEFDPALALVAYRCGVFPMPLDERMGWWSPLKRGVLPLDGLRISKSLRKTAARYTTTIDQAFPEVLAACSDPKRADGWIDDRIAFAYTALHQAGYVHSVETWDEKGRLVGGLYGVQVGGLFAGESMFHDSELGRDASKVALLRLVAELRGVQVKLLDVQWRTPHLATLGVIEVSRREYLSKLSNALGYPSRSSWGRDRIWGSRQLLAAYRRR